MSVSGTVSSVLAYIDVTQYWLSFANWLSQLPSVIWQFVKKEKSSGLVYRRVRTYLRGAVLKCEIKRLVFTGKSLLLLWHNVRMSYPHTNWRTAPQTDKQTETLYYYCLLIILIMINISRRSVFIRCYKYVGHVECMYCLINTGNLLSNRSDLLLCENPEAFNRHFNLLPVSVYIVKY